MALITRKKWMECMLALSTFANQDIGNLFPAQLNWITGVYERPPHQLGLDLPLDDPDLILPADKSVTLLATENGAQLIVAGYGLYVGKKSERIVIRHDREVCAQVPILRLQELIIASRGVSLSSDIIEELCSRGIRIAFLNNTGKPIGLLTSPLLTATVSTRRAQFDATANSIGAEFATRIVAGKLRNQDKLLRYFAKSRTGEAAALLTTAADQISALVRQVIKTQGENPNEIRGRLLGLEGTAGRIYWKGISGIVDGFDGRVHDASSSPVNAALNFGYGILYSHVWGAVMNAGLEPFAGFIHTDRAGKPSLVLDMVEEFRQPIVDRPIFAWLNRGGSLNLQGGLLDSESRSQVASRVLQRLNTTETYHGKSHQVRSIVQMQARRAAGFLRGEGRYRPFAFEW